MKRREYEVERQIKLTKDNIQYFENIEQQLAHITVDDIDEIRDELAEQGYMKARKQSKKKKNLKFSCNTIVLQMEIRCLSVK